MWYLGKSSCPLMPQLNVREKTLFQSECSGPVTSSSFLLLGGSQKCYAGGLIKSCSDERAIHTLITATLQSRERVHSTAKRFSLQFAGRKVRQLSINSL